MRCAIVGSLLKSGKPGPRSDLASRSLHVRLDPKRVDPAAQRGGCRGQSDRHFVHHRCSRFSRLEDTTELQPQIVMQPLGGVLLDHEPQAFGRLDLGVSGWFCGFGEVAFGFIFRKLGFGQIKTASGSITLIIVTL
jgi:hypothetical protein